MSGRVYSQPPQGSVYTGQQAVASAGTAEALGASQPLSRGLFVKANSDNSGNVFIGSSAVDSSTGLILAPGEGVYVAIDNVAKVYVDAATNDDAVSYIGS